MKLSCSVTGDGPPLVIAHGLFGSGRNWAGFAKSVSADFRTISVDMRNHGASPWDDRMDYPAMAEDLLATIDGEAGGKAMLLGHSMGGKAAMAAALTRPDAVSALIVVDIAPVVYRQSHASFIDAMQAVDLSSIERRGEADAALAAEIPDQGVRQFLLQNLELGKEGAKWRLNLDVLCGSMANLTAFPFEAGEQKYEGPTLFIGGSASEYLTPDRFDAVREFFPMAEIEIIDGAGHWVHAEKPAEFLTLATDFLARSG